MLRLVKKIGIVCLGLSLVGLLSLTITIVVILSDFPIHSFRSALAPDNFEGVKEAQIEEGGSSNIQELEYYYLFSNGQDDLKRWRDGLIQNGTLAIEKDRVHFLKDSSLPQLFPNRCQDLYCYQHPIPFEKIPSIFWKGLIGIEDERFLEHPGVDWRSVARALVTDLRQMRFAQGGSTLTQQLVKNLFLTNEKKISRKLKEMVYSIYIETVFSKEEILEGYLNEAYWGVTQGIRVKGLYAASVAYFAKKPQSISPYEATILISMLKGPGYYSPIDHLKNLKQRVQVIFHKLKEMNYVMGSGHEWSDKEWDSWQKDLLKRHQARYAYDLWDALNNQQTAFFDSYDQYIFRRAVNNLRPFIASRTGEQAKNISIKAYISDTERSDVFQYYSKVERSAVKALYSENHLVGSILKPVVYSIYLDMGKRYEDLVSLAPITLKLKSGEWSPREAHEPEAPEVSLIDALFHSYNRPVIHLAEELGWDEIEKRLLNYLPNLQLPLKEFPAQLLGGTEKSVADVYELYRHFVQTECAKERDDSDLYERNLLYKMSDPKLTTIRQVVGEDMGQLAFFGKTGTSNSGLDNWYVAFDGRLISVIWVGFEGDRRGVKLNLYGAGTSFRIFQYFNLNRGKRFNELDCDLALKK